MNKYAKVAIETTEILMVTNKNPKEVWEQVALKVFYNSPSSASKGCPKAAFLGLCENGNIKGIKQGNYTKSFKNKEYAIKAVEILKQSDQLVNKPRGLWEMVVDNKKAYNSQMDIVCELWKAGLINESK